MKKFIPIVAGVFLLFITLSSFKEYEIINNVGIVDSLAILITILIAWNIYSVIDIKGTLEKFREEMKDSKSEQKKNETDLNEKMEEKQKSIDKELSLIKKNLESASIKNKKYIDANINLMQGEVYLSTKYYHTAYREYILSCIMFMEIGEEELAKKIIDKAGVAIRRIRADIKNPGIAIDFDSYNDGFYEGKVETFNGNAASLAEIGINKEIKNYNEIVGILQTEAYKIMFNSYAFKLYKKDILIRERDNPTIYILVDKTENINKFKIHKSCFYDCYKCFESQILIDLESSYEYIALFSNADVQKVKECYDEIKTRKNENQEVLLIW
ncbi:MAG: hypothetical protein RRY07_07155 [Bacteroidaceae bacterium]